MSKSSSAHGQIVIDLSIHTYTVGWMRSNATSWRLKQSWWRGSRAAVPLACNIVMNQSSRNLIKTSSLLRNPINIYKRKRYTKQQRRRNNDEKKSVRTVIGSKAKLEIIIHLHTTTPIPSVFLTFCVRFFFEKSCWKTFVLPCRYDISLFLHVIVWIDFHCVANAKNKSSLFSSNRFVVSFHCELNFNLANPIMKKNRQRSDPRCWAVQRKLLHFYQRKPGKTNAVFNST